MDEQNVNTEVVEEVVETPVSTESSADDTNTPDTNTEAKPEKFKPWTQKQEEPKEQAIPYSRFKEVNDERKAYQAKIDEYEKELGQYRQKQEVLKSIKSPEEIKLSDYPDSDEGLANWQKDRDAAVIAQVEKRFADREIARQVEARNAEIVNRFEQNVAEAAKYNPDVLEARKFLDQYAHMLDPRVASELLVDENAGDLIHDLVTDQELLTKLFRGNPDETIRMMHKMSAKMDREARRAGGEVKVEAKVPVALEKKPVTGIPATAKSTSKAPTKDPGKMSQKEYAEWFEKTYPKKF